MRFLITGNAHSGTTLVARVLYECGLDFGEIPPKWIDSPNGMEHRQVQEAAHAVTREQTQGRMVPNHYQAISEPTRRLVRSALELRLEYTKIPNIGYTWPAWQREGMDPDAVLVCHRDLADCARSNLRRAYDRDPKTYWEMHARLAGQTGLLAAALWEHPTTISFDVVQFPMTVNNGLYLWRALDDLFALRRPDGTRVTEQEFLKAHHKVANRRLVHVRNFTP